MMKPEEHCDLQPTTDCQIVTSLIPHLIEREICEPVPKEFCHTKLDSPKMVKKPVTMKWCTFPTATGQLHTPSHPGPNPHVPHGPHNPHVPQNPHNPPHYYKPTTPPTTTTPSPPSYPPYNPSNPYYRDAENEDTE